MTDQEKSFEANFRPNCDPNLQDSLTQAKELAAELGHAFLSPEHLLAALMDNPEAIATVKACGAQPADLKAALKKNLSESKDLVQNSADTKLVWHENSIKICRRANFYRSTALARVPVNGALILIGFSGMSDTFAGQVLDMFEIDRVDIVQWINHQVRKGETLAPQEAVPAFAGGENRARAAGPESALEKYAVNLNEKARKGKIDTLIGRSDEIDQAVNILSCRRKSNVVFVGEAGVGKTAIAEGLAARIVSGDVPSGLKDCVVHALDMTAAVAGARYRGDFEERMKAIVKEASDDARVILFMDEIHTLLGAGSTQGSMDAANILKPELARGDLRCMGATTRKEYRKYFEKDEAIARRFQKVEVAEPTRDEAVHILRGAAPKFAKHHRVTYDEAALEAAVDLSIRYLASRRLPDKALDLIDLAGAVHSAVARPSDEPHPVVTVDEICTAVSKLAKVPVSANKVDRNAAVRKLSTELPMMIFNQQPAIDKLVEVVELGAVGLNDPDRPMASFLFAGPSGVGKSEMSKELARILELPLLRFDMTEYMEKHSVSRLIGAPPGYIGYDDGGLLTEGVEASPHCVLLLDEIEKAHPDVLNVLLQVLDDGRLTDPHGREIDFRNTIIVLTTNAGADAGTKTGMGFLSKDNDPEAAQDALKAAFSAPFRNRVDSIIQFNSLTESVVELVVDKEIYKLEKQLRDKRLTVSLSSAARSYLARLGFDKELGARPVRKVVKTHVRGPLARRMLAGEVLEGSGVKIDLNPEGNGLSFEFALARVALMAPAE